MMTTDNFKNALVELEVNFDDLLDSKVYKTSHSLVRAKNAKLLATYLDGQDTMPREHVFKIIEENVPNFAKEVAEIYSDLSGTEINFNEKLMSSVIPYDVN